MQNWVVLEKIWIKMCHTCVSEWKMKHLWKFSKYGGHLGFFFKNGYKMTKFQIKIISIKTTIHTSSLKLNKCGMDKLNNTQYLEIYFDLPRFNIIHPVCSLRNAGSSVIKTLTGSDLSFLCTWHISSLLCATPHVFYLKYLLDGV